MASVRSLNSLNFFRARASLIAVSFDPIARFLPGPPLARIVTGRDPALSEFQQGVVFLRGADGNPDTVSAVWADHDACVGGLLHEVQCAHSQRQPNEIRL